MHAQILSYSIYKIKFSFVKTPGNTTGTWVQIPGISSLCHPEIFLDLIITVSCLSRANYKKNVILSNIMGE